MWFRTDKKAEIEQRDKISRSQKLLLDAAISTADMANFVTTKLKQRLDEAIHQFDSTMAIMSDALLICDSHGFVKACNPAAQKIFTDSIMDTSVLGLLHKHGHSFANVDELWDTVRDNTQTAGLTGIRGRHHFPVEATMTRLDRADGSAVMMLLIRDVTDMVALKKEAEDNARGYRSLFELCFDGILIVQNEKIVAANHHAGKMFGVRAESLLRIEFTRLVNREDRDKLEDIETDPIEATALRGDGSPMSLQFSGTDIVWNNDKACLIMVRDISALKHFEKRYDNGIDMICCFDGHFNITFANDAFCTYYTVPRTIVGTDVRTLMLESERDAFLLNISCLSSDHPTRRVQICVGKKLQDWIDHAVYNEHGRIVEYQRTGRDVTDLITKITQ